MLNLDTHILIHFLNDNLTSKELKFLEAHQPWGISDIVLWEITKLSQLGRIHLDLKNPDFLDLLDQLEIWPITWDICQATSNLDFKSDPADEIIAATSLQQNIALLTRDKKMLKSKIVPLAKL